MKNDAQTYAIHTLPPVEGFSPIKQIHKSNISGKYIFVIYQNKKGTRAFAKILPYTKKNEAYKELKNEIHALAMVNAVSATNAPVSFITLIGSYDHSGLLIMLTEYIEAKSIETLSATEQSKIYTTSLRYLANLDTKTMESNTKHSILKRKTILEYYAVTVNLVVQVITKNHSLGNQMWRFISIFFQSLRHVITQKMPVFVHGDLVTNILVTAEGKVYITDLQTSAITTPDFEAASLLTGLWPDEAVFRVTKRLAHVQINPLLCLYCSTFALLDHTWTMDTYVRFLQYLA